jgi:hypothetical protein
MNGDQTGFYGNNDVVKTEIASARSMLLKGFNFVDSFAFWGTILFENAIKHYGISCLNQINPHWAIASLSERLYHCRSYL